MKTGVIIGRFQIDEPHGGHRYLINSVGLICDKLVILIGCTASNPTDKNPLSYPIRRDMIHDLYPSADIYPIYDNNSDEVWSNNVDAILSEYENVTLYGSRDSFIKSYCGKYPTTELLSVFNTNSTAIRQELSTYNPIKHNSVQFRQGVIHASMSRFPITYPVVDIAVVRYVFTEEKGKVHDILLGKKPGETKYRLIGGFVDPSDKSVEAAAYGYEDSLRVILDNGNFYPEDFNTILKRAN